MAEQKLLDLWLPPEGAGEPMAVLATSFTFNTDFFRDECLARFLGMRAAVGEEALGTIAQVNELEERLAQVTATAVVDRSAGVDSRNLRWDVVPVSQPGGLLHAKTALLIWAGAARVIIGSANLTPAGYRRQQEIAVAFDLETAGTTPRSFWDDYVAELKRIVDLIPADLIAPGPKSRALAAVSLMESRVAAVGPASGHGKVRLVLAPSRPGESALKPLSQAISGMKPHTLTAMSPFWDTEDGGTDDAVRSLTGLLTARGPAAAYLLVPLRTSEAGHLTNAPSGIEDRMARPGVEGALEGVDESPMGDFRRLHAKAVLLESDDWVTLMIGSSNMTMSGLGLHPTVGHLEMNIAYGAPRDSAVGKALLKVMPTSIPLDPAEIQRPDEAVPDEDEPPGAVLHHSFVSAMLVKESGHWVLLLRLVPGELPSSWEVATTDGSVLLNQSTAGAVEELVRIALPADERPPQGITVTWRDGHGLTLHADWIVNVSEPADLPLDERLRSIPLDLIIQALAMRGGDPSANLERLLERWAAGHTDTGSSTLDPLRSYDDSRALLRRMTSYGRALDRLTEQLSRPAATLSSLTWRLTGLVSPTRLAQGWVDQYKKGELPLELAHFLLAELQIVMARVDWATVTRSLDPAGAAEALAAMQSRWESAYQELPAPQGDSALRTYVKESRALHAT